MMLKFIEKDYTGRPLSEGNTQSRISYLENQDVLFLGIVSRAVSELAQEKNSNILPFHFAPGSCNENTGRPLACCFNIFLTIRVSRKEVLPFFNGTVEVHEVV